MANDREQEHTISIYRDADTFAAVRAAKRIAVSIGFDELSCEELVIVTRELSTNLVKHAGGGMMKFVTLHDSGRDGLSIMTVDNGPGIIDVEHVLTDGVSSGGSLGYGLGTVNRLMDELDITSRFDAGRGTRVTCLRWLRNGVAGVSCPLDIGASTRPHPSMKVNGDAFVIRKYGSSALAGVIDGLGHGQFAHRASQKARHYVENHYDQPLDKLFLGVTRECRATRGVVMALLRIDWEQETMYHASLGNIELRTHGCREPYRFIHRRGILGNSVAKAVVTKHVWHPGCILAMFSDGIVSHWKWDDFSDSLNESSTVLAGAMLRALARESDDATILIIKDRIP